MTVEDIMSYGGGGLVLLLTLIQIAPIKINPWSWLAKKIGNAFSHDVLEKLKDHDKKFELMGKEITALSASAEKDKADQCRRQILSFNDELLRNIDHSKEHFDNVLEDIDSYEEYCRTHDEYKNTKAVMAIENVKTTYKRLLSERGFL